MSVKNYHQSRRKRAKTLGFLSRSKTKGGKATITRRRHKGRKRLSA